MTSIFKLTGETFQLERKEFNLESLLHFILGNGFSTEPSTKPFQPSISFLYLFSESGFKLECMDTLIKQFLFTGIYYVNWCPFIQK